MAREVGSKSTLQKSPSHDSLPYVSAELLRSYLRRQPKINRISLNGCPQYTEIFSKRRKIYSVCVEDLRIVMNANPFDLIGIKESHKLEKYTIL